jgi:3-hydroxyisobutyrate dehydrogenase
MRIAFIGLGTMGLPMATHLVAAGHQVRGCDLRPAARDAFAAAGGIPARDAADAMRDAGDRDHDPAGERRRARALLAPGLPWRAGMMVVDMTSGVPSETRAIGEELARHGVAMLDAPVSGGQKGAVARTLTIMIGGDPALASRLQPLLAQMGARVFHCGALGAGQAAKALNNFVSAAGLIAAGEALTIGQRSGIDPERLVDILNASTGRNNSTENKLKPFVLSGTHRDGFALQLMAKDIAIAAGLARETGTTGGIAAATDERWRAAADGLPGDANHTEIARWLGFRAAASKD